MPTIIFDFGNVLGFFDHGLTLNRLVPFTDMSAAEMFTAVYGGPLEVDFESGLLSTDDFLRQVRHLCRLRCDVSFMAAAFADIFRPNPEVCDLIPFLKPNYRILLGSNTNELHARQFRRQFQETLGHFDHLVMSFEIGVRKPCRGFFEHCQRLAQCPPAECLFIDDLPANIAGARTLGWKTIHYTGAPNLRQQLQDLGVFDEVE